MFFGECISEYDDFKKKVVIETNSWSKQDKNYKLPKFANVLIYNAIIHILVNISSYFGFFEKAYLGTMISSQKVVHRTNSWSK